MFFWGVSGVFIGAENGGMNKGGKGGEKGKRKGKKKGKVDIIWEKVSFCDIFTMYW